jgi:hypothetical protein
MVNLLRRREKRVHSFIEALWVNGLFHPCFVSRFLPIPLKSPFRTFRILQSGWLSRFQAHAVRLYIRAFAPSRLRAFVPSRLRRGRRIVFHSTSKKELTEKRPVFG